MLEAVGTSREVACWRWPEIRVPADAACGALGGGRRSSFRSSSCYDRQCQRDLRRGAPERRSSRVRDISFDHRQGRDLRAGRRVRQRQVDRRARGQRVCLPPADGSDQAFTAQPLAGSRTRTGRRKQRRLHPVSCSRTRTPRSTRAPASARSWRGRWSSSSASRRADQARIERALADVRLDGRLCRALSDQLSGGERQRVAIARGLDRRADAAAVRRDPVGARRLRAGEHPRSCCSRLRAEHAHRHAVHLARPRRGAHRSPTASACCFAASIMEIGRRDQMFSQRPSIPTPTACWRPCRRRCKRGQHRGADAAMPPAAPSEQRLRLCRPLPLADRHICESDVRPGARRRSGLRIRCHHPLAELTRRADLAGASCTPKPAS